MTESLAGVRVRTIGAFELKRAYQSNLAVGLLLAAGLHLAAVAGLQLFTDRDLDLPPVVRQIPDDPGSIQVLPGVSIVPDQPQVFGGGNALREGTGIPVPVDDDFVPGDVSLPTREDLRRRVAGGPPGQVGVGGDEPAQWFVPDTFPAITDVILDAREPRPVRTVAPAYPAMAEKAGLEARVIVRVLVDASGRVQRAVIVRCSTPGVGFEESAREALMQWVFTPAVQNDHPVAIWINIPVHFTTE